MSTSSQEKSESIVSKRSLGVAALAAIFGCVACCALPLLAAAGVGGGALAALASLYRPGSELLVGGAAFFAVLAFGALRTWSRQAAGARCRVSCGADGGCCDHGGRAENA